MKTIIHSVMLLTLSLLNYAFADGFEIGNAVLTNEAGLYRIPKVEEWNYSFGGDNRSTTFIDFTGPHTARGGQIIVSVHSGIFEMAEIIGDWIQSPSWNLLEIGGLKGVRLDNLAEKRTDIRLFRSNDEMLAITIQPMEPSLEPFIRSIRSIK